MAIFAADEDFDNNIVRGIKRRRPDIDVVRIQDVGLRTADDQTVLEWASSEDRILLTHDASTMTAHVASRLRAGQPVPRVVVSPQRLAIGVVIDNICRIADAEDPSAMFRYPICFLPLP